MTTEIRLEPAAVEDIASAEAWYTDQDEGLGRRFEEELDRALRRIESFPEGFPVVRRDMRRANLRVFPYSVFYYRGETAWIVAAVVHHARNPSTWQDRMTGP